MLGILLCGALKFGQRRIFKSYKTIEGYPRFYLQNGVSILQWMMNAKN